jgi:hypothetical protein
LTERSQLIYLFANFRDLQSTVKQHFPLTGAVLRDGVQYRHPSFLLVTIALDAFAVLVLADLLPALFDDTPHSSP